MFTIYRYLGEMARFSDCGIFTVSPESSFSKEK